MRVADRELQTKEASAWYVTAPRNETPGLAEAKFSTWHQPPPDPDFLRRVRHLRWEKGVAAAAILAIWVFVLYAAIEIRHVSGFVGGLGQLLFAVSAAIWWRVGSRRASPHLGDLLDLPPVCPQFPVEITYSVGGYTYGSDEGIVSFVDDWLHFQGRRTSWSLRPSDVRVSARTVSAIKGPQYSNIAKDPRKRLTWKQNGEPRGISILPMDRIEGLGSGLRKRFADSLTYWQYLPAGEATLGILPPIHSAPGYSAWLERNFERWKVVRRVSLAAFVGLCLAAYLGMANGWWGFGGLIALVLTAFASSLAARCFCAVAVQCDGREKYRPVLPSGSGPGWWILRARLIRKGNRRRLELMRLLAAERSGLAIPVEVRYAFVEQEYRREMGLLIVSDGWVRFKSATAEWAVKRADMYKVKSSRTSWRSFFETRRPFSHVLTWDDIALVNLTILPVDKFGALGPGLISRLDEEMAAWGSSGEEPVGETVYPPIEPLGGEVNRMERAFRRWTAVKWASHLLWIGGLVLGMAYFDSLWAMALGMFALGMAGLITGEHRRGRLADRLEAIYRNAPDGKSMVTFRRRKGPWWSKIDQPWVK